MEKLNPEQQAAVSALDGPLLVLAGAGSGKTRVITEKIALLIRKGTPARHIAALTFTNKAAREMKTRVSRLVAERELRGLTVSTFHSLGLEILRMEHAVLGYKKNLSIFDEHDKITLIKELIKHTLSEWDVDQAKEYANQISRWKNLFVTPEQAASASIQNPEIAALYQSYTRQMHAYNAVDFDDLILLPVLLLQSSPSVLEKWQNRIRYLLIDEYQDTNNTQYQLVKLLAGSLGRFTVVGDDDQSIYAWRGAQPENLAHLQKDYPRLKVIKLEQNYRSTGRILKAANQLIANNPHVFEKRLWSALGYGDPIRVLTHKDDVTEARQIASDIIHHHFRQGSHYGDYAILYRSNHQSRPFEKALREHSIPYYITGGPSFFSYAEVKDTLAYLRLMVNPADDAAFLRIVNVPRREIGPTTLEKLGAYARDRHINLFAASQELGLSQVLPEPAVNRLNHFCQMINEVSHKAREGDTFTVVEGFIEQIGYPAWLRENTNTEEAARRKIAQVQELTDWLRRMGQKDDQTLSLDEVVSKIMLMDILDRTQEDEAGDRVHLMTLHAAKGLEFPCVYLVGMEEDILPHRNSLGDHALEEERRLAYVGITRAKSQLTLSYCTHRKRQGESLSCKPSRFLDELPENELEWPERNPLSPETKRERALASLAHIKNMLK
ncbi:MAG: UvrD-helicase domain-containing protein [Methylococcaceae bacterium]